jgi:pimeloyl-ACP methyl ester carboxylesterase
MQCLRKHNLVFLPGLDGTGFSFEPLRKRIPPDMDVTIIRYPDHDFLSFEETVEYAAAQVPPDAYPVVIAESFSGPVAVQLIGSGRLKAKCLILCATFAKAPRPILLRIAQVMPLTFLMGLPVPQRVLKAMLGNNGSGDGLLSLWGRIRAAVAPSVLAHRLRMLSRVDVTPWLERLSLPCCYLQAAGDRVVPPSCLSIFAERIPNLVVKCVDGPHFILQARPQACLTAIDEFLRLAKEERETEDDWRCALTGIVNGPDQ